MVSINDIVRHVVHILLCVIRVQSSCCNIESDSCSECSECSEDDNAKSKDHQTKDQEAVPSLIKFDDL